MSDKEPRKELSTGLETAKLGAYGWWYDPATGLLGYGPTFGERSINGKRIGAIYGWENVNSYLRGEWNGLGIEIERR